MKYSRFIKMFINLSLIFLALPFLISCAQHVEPGGAQVMGVAIAYAYEKQTNPDSLEALKEFANEKQITVDWSQFSRLYFMRQPDGSLLVEFESEKSKGSFTLGPIQISDTE